AAVSTVTSAAETGGEVTVCDIFAKFPDKYLAIIPAPVRLDMLDYLKADSLVHVRNAYRGESWIEEYKPGYLRVHITNVSSLQIKKLHDRKRGDIFMAVYTVASDNVAADSQILFFDAEANQLETGKYFKLPDPKHFWLTPDNREGHHEQKRLQQEVPFYAIEYTLSPDDDVLTGRISSISFLSEEMKREIMPKLVKEMRWRWNGRRFERVITLRQT
ncbi:MAG: DUF3256 family protein, partial [Muribaculaceae bacterium]|nr:DUF3256 family protein [Muribaculaceae bacterium]